ncbi:unnamed protein product [Calicophoron daubneyi]|uniref:GCF C-terminal domain-containing protein n=1 Tax=Calicophoron daubneyi TaxID=300641 RepID=A0AAV2TFA3_CALDB
MFIKKSRRNYRHKANDSDDETPYAQESLYEEGAKGTICPPAPPEPGPSGGIKKVRSVLSFEDDLGPDDGNMFKVKKTNLSRRLSKQAKEHKKKKETDEDIVKVVNRKEKVEPKAESPEDPVDSEEKLEKLRKQLLDLAEDEPPTSAVSESSVLKKGIIPDAATIHMARKQRERAKIMMETTDCPKSSGGTAKNDGNRLVREDDDDEEDDIEDNVGPYAPAGYERRPAFVVSDERDTVIKRPAIGVRLNRGKAERESIRKDFLATENASDRDSDQESEWEMQQIQKAMISQNQAVIDAIQPVTHRTEESLSPGDPTFAGLDPNNVTVANLKSVLQAKYDALSSDLSKHETALREAKTDLERGKQVIADCRKNLPVTARKFAFAQEMKSYVDDLVECFNEKMSKIEYLERRTIGIYREKYNKLVERRRLDMKDMADLATQPPSAPQSSKNPEEAKALEMRRRRCAERESRRIRRQRAREMNAASHTFSVHQPHREGTSTDDEEPQAVVAKRKADIDALLVDANALFDDVVEEFCHLPLILQRFADWHADFPESYAQAYVSLCLPKLLSPIVRVQLIGWNPLADNPNALEQMNWFFDLLDFACLPTSPVKQEPSVNGSSEKTMDDDLRILPHTVEKVVLQRLNDLVFASWDPLSSHESLRLVELVRELTTTYPTIGVGSRATEQLFATIVKRMELTIQEDIFIPLYSKYLMQNRQGQAYLFFERQLQIGIKMLKNVLLWHDLLSTEALQHVSLTCLVNRYLLVGLASLLSASTSPAAPAQNESKSVLPLSVAVGSQEATVLAFQDAVDRLTEIVDAIPLDWLRGSIEVKLERDKEKDVFAKPVIPNDAFTQLKRFVAQLLEHCSTPESGTGENLEREWLATLKRLKETLDGH